MAINSTRRVDVEGRLRRGYAYRNLKQYDKAAEDFTKVLQAAPKDPEAYRRRAYAYTLAGQNEEAMQDLKKILELKPDDKDAKARIKSLQAKMAKEKPAAVAANAKPAASPGTSPAPVAQRASRR